MSAVMRQSTICFKQHLNYWVEFHQTSQEWSLDCLLSKLFRFQFHAEFWLPWQPKGKTLKIFLSETTRPRALILGMWHHLVDLYQIVPLGPKWPRLNGFTCLHRLIYREYMKNPFCLKVQGLESWYLVCSITWWVSTKFVQIGGQKWPRSRGHMLYIGLYMESIKNQGQEPWYLVCSNI